MVAQNQQQVGRRLRLQLYGRQLSLAQLPGSCRSVVAAQQAAAREG